jgi:hypothetical protein
MSPGRASWAGGSVQKLRPRRDDSKPIQSSNTQSPKSPAPHGLQASIKPVRRSLLSPGVTRLEGPGPRLPGIRCPYCSERFLSDDRKEDHLNTEHVADSADTSEAAMARPLVLLRGLVFERRVRLRAERLVNEPQPEKPITPKVSVGATPKMLSNKPANVVPNSRRFVQSAPSRSARVMVQCPECPSLVREDHLQKHRSKIHGMRKATPPIAASTVRKSSKVKASSRPHRPAPGNDLKKIPQGDAGEKLIENPNYREERRLDGSRDYWQIREIGRFGSHPSYDDCDDESRP